MTLVFRGKALPDDETLVMAIVNRTPDSFFDRGRTYELDRAMERVDQVVAEGAHLVDIGGVKAAPGDEVPLDEEIRRVVELVEPVRERYTDLVISVDTYRAAVADAACRAGADVVNDAWGGVDPDLPHVTAAADAALVCTHAGHLPPRTRPHRTGYADVVADVVATTTHLATTAVAAGVDPASVLVDPGHDFGKNTHHSLEVTRRLPELVAGPFPVLVSLSNKDFVGETLDRPVPDRLVGTLAVTSVCAWLGARVFRAHNVRETRDTLDMVATLLGQRRPSVTRRGLA